MSSVFWKNFKRTEKFEIIRIFIRKFENLLFLLCLSIFRIQEPTRYNKVTEREYRFFRFVIILTVSVDWKCIHFPRVFEQTDRLFFEYSIVGINFSKF